jgi:hypothetical protein
MQTEALPLTETQMQEWWSEIDRSERVRKEWEKWWEANLDAYAPKPTKDPKTYGADINTNRDYQLTEQKKAQLFFQTPEINVKPSPLMMGQEDAILAHQDILNEMLGDDGVNAKGMMDEALFDVLCPSGFGVTKMGYENVTEMVETEVPVPDPMTGAPAVDPMTGQPMTIPQQVPVPIWERLFWERVTPKKVLIPAGFASTNYDEAPWLGVRFSLTLNEARLRYQLPDDFEGKAGKDEFKFDHGTKGEEEGRPVEGVEIWYRAAVYDQSVRNPDLLRCLVLIKGLEQPVKHMDSPYQELDPNTGRLSPRSLKGYPIHILTIRTLADSAYVMSDCSISRPQVNELNKFREQQIKLRDSNIPIRLYDTDRIPPEVKAKLDNADYGSTPIGVPTEAFAGNPPVIEIAKATYPRENLAFEEKQDSDIARTHAMDANQGGVKTDEARTATELQLIQVNTNTRLDKERSRVLAWYVKGVTKFSTLVQRFVTVEQAAQIVGPQRAQVWKQAMEQVPAALAFTALPDSALRVDAAQQRKMTLEKYQYLRNDPMIDAIQFLRKDVLPVMGVSPSSIKPPAPPQPPPPDPPKVSISVKGEDLIPFAPQYPGILLVLKSSGLDVNQLPPPQLHPPTMNPGLVQPEKGLSGAKQDEGSGGMQGSPFKAPIASGGAGMDNAN